MSDRLTYPVPFHLLFNQLTRPILENNRANVSEVYRGFVRRMNPAPVVMGLEHLPESPRFILAANHYQRKGLWIAHIASVLAVEMESRYSCHPPVRWIVTANWPRWRLGPVTIPSPGDVLLPRVAHALFCYAVPFAGTNPSLTARSLRRVLKEAAELRCPIGLFPEGATATTDRLSPALPGVGRFLSHLAARGWPVVPVHVSEDRGFVVRFRASIAAAEIVSAAAPGDLVMERIAGTR